MNLKILLGEEMYPSHNTCVVTKEKYLNQEERRWKQQDLWKLKNHKKIPNILEWQTNKLERQTDLLLVSSDLIWFIYLLMSQITLLEGPFHHKLSIYERQWIFSLLLTQ